MKKQITIRLPEELKKEIQKQAEQKGISLNELILIIIHQYLKFQSCRVPFQNQKYDE